MNKLTDYVLAIRTTGAPRPPAGIKTVDLVPGAGDAASATVAALRASGLTAGDFRSKVIFLAANGSGCLAPYAALCGFAGRRIDAYADGVVLEFSRLDPDGEAFTDAGRPPGHLMWAQVGGPVVAGLRTVHLAPGDSGQISPAVITVIRYAARLRMVPPDSAKDALAMFVLVAAVRRRAADRFPYVSTGTEPVPVTKTDPDQGIDLEKIRREAAQYRRESRGGRRGAEIVPPVAVSARNRRIAEADAADIRTMLRRLGATCDGGDMWHCPRPRRHRNGDRNPSMKVYGDNRTRCHACDAEKIGPVRLLVDTLGLTPDEAARFILDSDRVIDMRAA